jgi:2-dehydro-3-deoxygluconokinase
LAYIDGQQLFIEPQRVDLVDATGAGDCFAGVLLASLCAGETMPTALAHANAAAAIATTGFGAVAPLPTRHQVLQTLSSQAAESSHVS